MSKFDSELLYDEGKDRYVLAVSKEKYSFIQSLDMARKEFGRQPCIRIAMGFVRYRFGEDEFGGNCAGWFIERQAVPRSCPCWILWPENRKTVIWRNYEEGM